ncbi:MAG: CDP-alcohol phosphatidyltransferase family protein [Candidatus Aceula meridiana]|nr:CDP-alcohol phosphatidyltransferase family protein [Candidatus Aceula meridiana]
MCIIKYIPNVLTFFRFVISAMLVFDAIDGQASAYFAPLFILAALTDFLDGFIARKFNVMSVRGAMLDGYADIALYCSVLVCIWFLFPYTAKKYLITFVGLIGLQIFSWGFSYLKFKRITSYHTYNAKFWGLMLFVSIGFLFVFSNDFLLVPMFIIAAISLVEDIAITSVLPCWKSDVKNFVRALRIRKEYVKL